MQNWSPARTGHWDPRNGVDHVQGADPITGKSYFPRDGSGWWPIYVGVATPTYIGAITRAPHGSTWGKQPQCQVVNRVCFDSAGNHDDVGGAYAAQLLGSVCIDRWISLGDAFVQRWTEFHDGLGSSLKITESVIGISRCNPIFSELGPPCTIPVIWARFGPRFS